MAARVAIPYGIFLITSVAVAQSAPPPPQTADKCCAAADDVVDPNAPLPMDRKSQLLRTIARELTKSAAPFLGEGALPENEKRLAALPPRAEPVQVFTLRLAIGDQQLAIGRIEDAIQSYDAAVKIAIEGRDAKARLAALHKLALAWLRFGERQNCIARHNPDSCIFPLRDGAIHTDRRGSERAIEYLTEILETDGGDLGAMWLLNVAEMTLGRHPDGVPRQWLIPPESFASERSMPRMPDVAPKLGLNVRQRAGGSIMDDFNGDGRLDVLVSSMDQNQPLRMMLQQPDRTFKNAAAQLGLSGQLGGLNLIHFDADNDGRLDILVQRGAWLLDSGRIPNSLLIQQGDGTFVDRTRESGIEIQAPSQVAAVADIDNDGDLDLFLGYESNRYASPVAYPSKLFKNRGDGTFEDVTELAGVQNDLYCKGAAFGDYDGDRLPDLYVSNVRGDNRLYHNNGNGTFTDVALEQHVIDPFDGFGCWFFDYNNDGWLDLYASSYNQTQVSRSAEMAAYYKNGATGLDTQRLYENDGRGNLRDVTAERHLRRVVFPMGCNFGDIDNDGWLDIYLATGDPDFTSLWPNVMYRNDEGKRFEDVTTATGTGHLQKGHGVSFGDLDDDGDQDLFVELGGAYKDDVFTSVMFENPGHGNHWLTVHLVGHVSNRFGVGSRIRVTIEENGAQRDVYAFVGANSSFGGNSLQEEIGLGKATRIVRMEIFWPTTGHTQTFHDVRLDRAVVVDENSDQLTDFVPGALPAAPKTHG